MKIVLISGKAQHGKDTVAQILKTILEEKLVDSRVLISHYADLLKYICEKFFRWNGEKDEQGRALLQYVGTDIIRKDNPNLWVDFMCMMLKYCRDKWDYVIIPDCRFPNEIERLQSVDANIFHLRVVRDKFESPLSKAQQCHISETALDNTEPDCFLCNNGSLSELGETVREFVDYYLEVNK